MSMEWFRWYHGTVSDPKLALIAKKTGLPRPTVIAVWAAMLECASEDSPRGSLARFDCECVAVALDIDESDVLAIMAAMDAKGMISDGRVGAWDKRQPQREDPTSTARVQAYRERKKRAMDAQSNLTKRNETQCNATKREETPEEIREDKEKIRGEEEEIAREKKTGAREKTPPSSLPQDFLSPDLPKQVVDAWNRLHPEATVALTPKRSVLIAGLLHDIRSNMGRRNWPVGDHDLAAWLSEVFGYARDHAGYLKDRDFGFFLDADRLAGVVEGRYEPRH